MQDNKKTTHQKVQWIREDHLSDFWMCETRIVQQMARHHDIYIIIIIVVDDDNDDDVIHPLILSYKCLGLHKKYLHVIRSWFIYWHFQLIKLYDMKWQKSVNMELERCLNGWGQI